jgi:hypothetical protein
MIINRYIDFPALLCFLNDEVKNLRDRIEFDEFLHF